ncbi:MAG: hypothetical protein AAFQ45_05370 [Pseudomonadota bacterium]
MLGTADGLATIPVTATSAAFPLETLEAHRQRADALLDDATRGVPRSVLRTLDAISRRWIAKACPEALPEIDLIAEHLKRPGAYFLSVNYEWGCTAAVRTSDDGASAELVRVLDWHTPGLGRHVIAADVQATAGSFATLTWPGFTGVLQATAPGRFAASLNQAPMARAGGGLYPLDWFANRVRVWRKRGRTPGHLLRAAFETCRSYDAARELLATAPITAPCIYAIAGLGPREMCIIERTEADAAIYDGPGVTANVWRTPGWHGRPRGADNAERVCQLSKVPAIDATMSAGRDAAFDWVGAPVRNDLTRLMLRATPASGDLIAQGFEADGPATHVLAMADRAAANGARGRVAEPGPRRKVAAAE